MIVSILFFEMNLGAALWTGLLAGFAYSIMVRLMYRQVRQGSTWLQYRADSTGQGLVL